MKVSELMTRDALTVSPDMPVGAVAAMLSERGASGAVVVGPGGELLGVVTETDLEKRLSAGAAEPKSWLARLLTAAPAEARSYAKSHGRYVRDIMTPAPVTTGPHASVEEAARLLDRHGVRRLPVVEGDRLVGVIGRADLLRAVLDPEPPASAPLDDLALRRKLADSLRALSWTRPYSLHFTVRDGVATFYGFAAPSDIQRGLRVAAEGVPGMKGVVFA